ncbi:D-ribose pyranase [Litorilinea aerophila]|uniref:D-ribose pyranase n=1 Tax=Litorilinea aerophila TaxID=1204385 RepID=A0A540VLT5_9CHLR|nr:D-ribose pyranase [Litorilinea aerophila]MCC9074928.1 D-ribose pyranase [Litorilinea aerophila]OUC09727.1 ribose pyranase [Litorilinea aerophila]GIV76914.1 MAG: D-ribose pyranase [Litorilinea sp.]
MKKMGILNAEIAAVVARMGHTDTLCIADAGLPIPPGPQRIDLAVRPGLPGFLDVLAAVLEELTVERVIVASEMVSTSPELYRQLVAQLGDVPVETVLHTEFKQRTASCKAVVRTGEFTPYANVILVSGVTF